MAKGGTGKAGANHTAVWGKPTPPGTPLTPELARIRTESAAITDAQIDAKRAANPGMGWPTALRMLMDERADGEARR